MKKIFLFFSFLCLAGATFCQIPASSYDSSFRTLYKELALHPWHRNSRGIFQDSVIRRWDRDIAIFVEGGSSKDRREILDKLKNTIAFLSPALSNKIRISFAVDKSAANYLISLTHYGINGWHLTWDGLNNIYNCSVNINTRLTFNRDQQAALASHYLLHSLGDFVSMSNTAPVVSNMRYWRQDLNDIDLQIVRLHYSDNIKPGMAKKDIDKVFSAQSN